MKKIAKLSLVAAVAVAGLTNVNAASLEEAIKGVDVSGQFRFRFQEKNVDGETATAVAPSTKGTNNETGTDVEIELTAKVPVTENVKAVFKIDNANNDGDTANTSGSVDIEDYYFSYNAGDLTVTAGQQNIPGRMTDGAQGDGAVALYNLGNITVGAAAFANHNVDLHSDTDKDGTVNGTEVDAGNGQSVLSVIAMGTMGPVSVLGQYAQVDDVAKAYNLKADAGFDMVKVGAEYTALKLDSVAANAFSVVGDEDDRSTLKAYVSGSVGIVSAKLTYAETGKNGSGSIDSQINSSVETPSEFLLWNLGTSNNANMDLYAIDASVKVTPKISLRAAYAAGEIDDGTNAGNDVEEILGQISYKVSKNLNTYVRYAQFDTSSANDNDGQRGRVEVKYSF